VQLLSGQEKTPDSTHIFSALQNKLRNQLGRSLPDIVRSLPSYDMHGAHAIFGLLKYTKWHVDLDVATFRI